MQDDKESYEAAVDALRAIAPEAIEADDKPLPPPDMPAAANAGAPAGPVRYTVKPAGEPQDAGTEFSVTDMDTGQSFYAGKIHIYRTRRGLSRSSTLLIYDRNDAATKIGAWAHFMWPSVMAESNGRYISINAWDRAHFTWGFYQLAAHTARDNLILLMRELVQLPSAQRFFPDLTLYDGKVSRVTPTGPISLEREEQVQVGSRTETQIPDFMKYLNPSSFRLDNGEVITAAKFAAWAQADEAMRDATVRVSVAIMRRKAKRWGEKFGLNGKRPELAIWVSDMFHHGRGDEDQVRAALARPTFQSQLDALSVIDTSGQHAARLATVKRHVNILLDERRFENVQFGEGDLSFVGV